MSLSISGFNSSTIISLWTLMKPRFIKFIANIPVFIRYLVFTIPLLILIYPIKLNY